MKVYSYDLAYLDYFQYNALEPDESSFIELTGIVSFTESVSICRILYRGVDVVVEVAKVVFYAFAALFTLGGWGNSERLWDHVKLLGLSLASLIALPVQMIVHMVAVIVGIVDLSSAYKIMEAGTAFIAWISSQENSILEEYKTPEVYTKILDWLFSGINELFKECSQGFKAVVGTVMNEFWDSIDAGLTFPIGCLKSFHVFGANPKELTPQQKKLTPILLLHGNYSHQGTFLKILHALKSSQNQKPVYTLELPSNTTNVDLIKAKVEEIKALYERSGDDSFEIDMIGHSMGAYLIGRFLDEETRNAHVSNAITIGTPFFFKHSADLARYPFDIVATQDQLVPYESYLPENQHLNIDTGHLSLMYHQKTLSKVVELVAAP